MHITPVDSSEEDVMDLAAFVTEYRHFEFDLLAARCVFAEATRRRPFGRNPLRVSYNSNPGIAAMIFLLSHDEPLVHESFDD